MYERTLLDMGIPSEYISLIPNGLDTDFFRPPQVEEREKLRSRHGYDSQTVVLLFLGRLIHRKRPDLLLRALAHLETNQQVNCLIVGDGPRMGNLQKIAQDLGIGTQVEFAGSVDNVRDFYWLSDIFVLPSRWEGLPVALLESMACGLTPLVSSCEGNLEVVTPERDGLSHAVDDLKSLKAQVERLVADAALRRRLGQEARRPIVESYGLDAVAESHLRIYGDLLGQKISSSSAVQDQVEVSCKGKYL
jgi:glycosyltransferase involved in cell wall biosynthesis